MPSNDRRILCVMTAAVWATLGVLAATASGMLAALLAIGGRMEGLTARIDNLNGGLSARIDGLSARIDGLQEGLNGRIDGLSARVELVTASLEDHRRQHLL